MEAIGTGAEAVTKLFRAPIAGFTGLAKLPQGIDVAAESTRDILNRGVGPVGGEKIAEVTGSPALGAVFSAIPVAIVAALGLRGTSKVSGVHKAASDVVTELLQKEGFDRNDGSSARVSRTRYETGR